ncbi:MAG: hypothetical protein MUP63_01220 [Candidatus Nanohaloarchaeota archaeon QJJ-7]|nr:hypothetical protein [Candidatus Nanohaloarchaeota archaeon QJJ-7]
MTTSSEVVKSYQELEEEVSRLACDIGEISDTKDYYRVLQRIESETLSSGRTKKEERIVRDLDSLGMVEEEEYRVTLFGKAYVEHHRSGYGSSDNLDFSDSEAVEKGLWRMSIGVDVDSDRISCPVGDTAEELDEIYNELRESYSDLPNFSDLRRREEAIVYMELGRSAQDTGKESIDDEFIGMVNSGLEKKVDLYVGRIREEGNNFLLPTHTGEIVRTGERVDGGLDLVKVTGTWGGIPGGERIGSFEMSELEEFLSGISSDGN